MTAMHSVTAHVGGGVDEKRVVVVLDGERQVKDSAATNCYFETKQSQ